MDYVMHGRISSAWSRMGDSSSRHRGSREHKRPAGFLRMEKGRAVFRVGSGTSNLVSAAAKS